MTANKIEPAELKRLLDKGEKITILDVREPHELNICSIKGTLNIPMAEVPQKLDLLDKNAPLVVMCRSGKRSMSVIGFLQEQGFNNLINLEGGILAWADKVDTTLTKY